MARRSKKAIAVEFDALYKGKDGRWRTTRTVNGKRRGGIFAAPPEPGQTYFDKQGRKRKAVLNKRGKLSSKLVRGKGSHSPRDVQSYSRKLRRLWAVEAAVRTRDVAMKVEVMQRRTTVTIDDKSGDIDLGYDQVARIMGELADDKKLGRAMERKYPGFACAIRSHDPETEFSDWHGHVATSKFRIMHETAEFHAEASDNRYGQNGSVVDGFHVMMFHQ